MCSEPQRLKSLPCRGIHARQGGALPAPTPPPKNAPESIFPKKGKPDSQEGVKTISRCRRKSAKTPLENIPHGILSPKRRHALVKECGNSARFAETLRRTHLVFRAIALQYSGKATSQSHTAKLLKVAGAPLFRYQDSLFKKGLSGLIPGKSSGRPYRFPLPVISEDEINSMFIAGVQSYALRRIQAFMRSPICRPELRTALEKNIPRKLIERVQSLIKAARLPAPWMQTSSCPDA